MLVLVVEITWGAQGRGALHRENNTPLQPFKLAQQKRWDFLLPQSGSSLLPPITSSYSITASAYGELQQLVMSNKAA